jgi:hypothetical protein
MENDNGEARWETAVSFLRASIHSLLNKACLVQYRTVSKDLRRQIERVNGIAFAVAIR